MNCKWEEAAWSRLAAYEDTGLTPGDIKELLDVAVSKTNKVLRLKEELQGAKNTAEQYAAINETLFDSNMKLGADRKDLICECVTCQRRCEAPITYTVSNQTLTADEIARMTNNPDYGVGVDC